jgi:hypothetical protein
MLNGTRLTIVADSVVNDIRIATFGAVLNLDDMELSLTSRHIDKELCKINRDVVRKDQADFEDYAYDLQDRMKK